MTRRTLLILAATLPAFAATAADAIRIGQAAYGDYQSDAPGVWRRITPSDLPAPYATAPATLFPRQVPRPAGARARTLPGFTVTAFATGLKGPRRLRTAPNGDVFVAESAGAGSACCAPAPVRTRRSRASSSPRG